MNLVEVFDIRNEEVAELFVLCMFNTSFFHGSGNLLLIVKSLKG